MIIRDRRFERYWMLGSSSVVDRNEEGAMASSSAGLHEDEDDLRPGTIDRHRAIVSLMEELEAVDWYDQRADAAEDPELRAMLAHHRDEEKEHAAMLLDWLRRRDPGFDEELRTYLFNPEAVAAEIDKDHREGTAGGDERPQTEARGDGSLGIGGLREEAGL
jgi:uncharacterized protein